MNLKNRFNIWARKHFNVFSRKPKNGKQSLEEMDNLLDAIRGDTERICIIVEKLVGDTAELKEQMEQKDVANVSSR